MPDTFMDKVKIRLKPEHSLAIKKVHFEEVMSRDNLTFLFNSHVNDTDDTYLKSEQWQEMLSDYMVKHLRRITVEQGIAEIVTGCHEVFNTHYEYQIPYIILEFDGEIRISAEYSVPVKDSGRRFVSFTDAIAQYYPDVCEDNATGADRVLSRTVTLQVTDACNLACTYCYQINKGKRRLKFDDAKLFIDKLLLGTDGFDKYVSPKISPGIVLDFIGGEPFLEIDLIDKIVDYFRMRCLELKHPWSDKFCISICSNGVLYNNPEVQRFLQKNHNCISFSVTLDGNKELHDSCRIFPDGRGSYELAEAATRDWMSRGYYMGSKITISPENLPFIYDALVHIVGLGYTEINANCVYEAEWTEVQAGQLYHLMKDFADFMLSDTKYEDLDCSLYVSTCGHPKSVTDLENWCGGTGVMLSMDPDGWLYPCIRYMESSLGTEQLPMRIGNVHTGLAVCDEDQLCVECLQKINRRTQSTDECFYCPIAEGCSWCSAYNYQVYGTADKRVTRICCMHRGRVLANVYYWNNYYKKYGIDKYFDLWIPRQWALKIISEDEYNELVSLVKELGGYVNESDTEISDYE